MAEGHLVLRWANRLKVLINRPLEAVEMPSRWSDRAWLLVGQHVTKTEARGKHLLLHLSDGQTIHCHALMFGSWQIGKPGMKPRKKEQHVRLRLRTAQAEAVFFHGPVVELLAAEELEKHRTLMELGPDILNPRFDRREVWRRLQRDPCREIGDALLDQTIVAGIGNIYKSEGLFLAAVDPRRPVGELDCDEVDSIWNTLIPLMQDGVRNYGPITTLPPEFRKDRERNWVYRRNKKPCHRCGESVQAVRQGPMKRTTYFCSHCQPETGSAG